MCTIVQQMKRQKPASYPPAQEWSTERGTSVTHSNRDWRTDTGHNMDESGKRARQRKPATGPSAVPFLQNEKSRAATVIKTEGKLGLSGTEHLQTAQSFFLRWWKCSGRTRWFWLHRFVSRLKATEQYSLKAWILLYVIYVLIFKKSKKKNA